MKMSCLYRDGEVMTYKEGQKDVKVMDVEMARGTFYTPIYDPRLIGLMDVKHVGDMISLALYLQRPGHFEAEKIEDGRTARADTGSSIRRNPNSLRGKSRIVIWFRNRRSASRAIFSRLRTVTRNRIFISRFVISTTTVSPGYSPRYRSFFASSMAS